MPAPLGYVGYTVEQAPVFKTCVASYAVLPDPDPQVAVAQNEHADKFTTTPAQEAAFAAAVTLKIQANWFYDGCNDPPNPGNCNKRHCFQFGVGTFDPNVGPNVVTWEQSTLRYESDP